MVYLSVNLNSEVKEIPLKQFSRVFIMSSSTNVAGERCNIRGEYFERGSTSKWKIVVGLLNVSQRILCNKQRILSFLMPNECPGFPFTTFFLHQFTFLINYWLVHSLSFIGSIYSGTPFRLWQLQYVMNGVSWVLLWLQSSLLTNKVAFLSE